MDRFNRPARTRPRRGGVPAAWLLSAVAAAALLGCKEELTVPGRCPELCPGGQPVVRDTIVFAVDASDTAFFGYTGRGEVTALLVSNGIAAGEARGWVAFPQRPDSVTISGAVVSYATDSVVIAFNLVARDTMVDGLKLVLHRLPRGTDTLAGFADIEAGLVPESVIDSILVPDSVVSGSVRVTITDSSALANLIPAADSGYLTLGVRLTADAPTGVRLGSAVGGSGAATFTTYARADVADTALQRQTLSFGPDANGFVLDDPDVPPDPDLLYAGRIPGARSIIRFPIPAFLQDSSVALVRATLELTPAETIQGLRGDAGSLEVRGVVTDIGAKSTATFGLSGSTTLPLASSDLVSVEVLSIVQAWRGPSGLPPAILIGLAPDGGSFHRPVFYSTRAADGKPRVHITYLRPSAVEQP